LRVPRYQLFIRHQTSAAMPPRYGRAAPAPSAHGHSWKDRTVRKTLIALAATTGLIGLGTIGASAAPAVPAPMQAQAANIHQADWCGPRCDYWRHRRWEARHDWREHHHPYYGYNGYYGYGQGYYRYR
jgi:hypothetical protein